VVGMFLQHEKSLPKFNSIKGFLIWLDCVYHIKSS
jgi:hypothetical protein